ncbi:MAG: FAD-dependent oxidoreductase [Clostridia bacterium]|nr:FAD-dependent oxidoreductase [Clostridia bacterium]
MKTDVLIIGAGPAGIFTALELVEMQSDKRILIVEKGESIERRYCPKVKCGVCMKCKNCAITTGFSGAGAFSDGKLSLSADVGGDLPDLIGRELAQETIRYVDGIYLKFGADERVEGLAHPDKVAKIRQKATEAGLRLVECPIRHMGTERAHDIYFAIEKHLIASGVEMYFNTPCKDLMIEDGACSGAVIYKDGKEEIIYADKVVVATGRRGADWLERACKAHGIEHQPGTVDVGVRVEVKSEVMSEVNEALYESKLIGYPQPFKNKVRTFCQNPGGFVAQENYDNALAVVNGHSFKDKKSSNTNLAILCSHNFSVPFDRPIEFAQKVGELTNMLGAGRILVQRYGDILKGKRTWQKELDESSLRPTLTDAVAGDITSAMPYRSMLSILNFIKQMDIVVPGFADDETLLYSPELKFYSNKIKMDKNFNTSVRNLHCLGDSSGWTRGLMMASVMGVLMARRIL